jgi:hypothetical protein
VVTGTHQTKTPVFVLAGARCPGLQALLRAAQAADTIGARAVLVHAKGDNAKGFYVHFDYEPSPSDPYHLLLIIKDVLKIIGKFGT